MSKKSSFEHLDCPILIQIGTLLRAIQHYSENENLGYFDFVSDP